jgi:hypothetical protein
MARSPEMVAVFAPYVIQMREQVSMKPISTRISNLKPSSFPSRHPLTTTPAPRTHSSSRHRVLRRWPGLVRQGRRAADSAAPRARWLALLVLWGTLWPAAGLVRVVLPSVFLCNILHMCPPPACAAPDPAPTPTPTETTVDDNSDEPVKQKFRPLSIVVTFFAAF